VFFIHLAEKCVQHYVLKEGEAKKTTPTGTAQKYLSLKEQAWLKTHFLP